MFGFRDSWSACVAAALHAALSLQQQQDVEHNLDLIVPPPFVDALVPAEVLKTPGLPDVTDMAACAPFASGCVAHRDLLALKCG